MEFGSDEWFKKLEERVKFPSVFALYVSNEGEVYSSVVKSKADNVGNIRYSSFSPNTFFLYKGEDIALTDVVRIHSPKEYYEKVKSIKEIWSK